MDIGNRASVSGGRVLIVDHGRLDRTSTGRRDRRSLGKLASADGGRCEMMLIERCSRVLAGKFPRRESWSGGSVTITLGGIRPRSSGERAASGKANIRCDGRRARVEDGRVANVSRSRLRSSSIGAFAYPVSPCSLARALFNSCSLLSRRHLKNILTVRTMVRLGFKQ